MSAQVEAVEFYFTGTGAPGANEQTDYAGFNLNGVEYKVGEAAFLYPSSEGSPHYIGQLVRIFHDRSGRAADPHCVEVAWYERRANLGGVGSERELVQLEEPPSVNPIGCLSGKCFVARAGSQEEAERLCADGDGMEVFFCRGVFQQALNSFIPYPELADDTDFVGCKRSSKRLPGAGEVVADSEDAMTQKRVRYADEQAAAPVRRTGKLVSGRTCVECGATQTPQWREGPAGPKTLCNACGVRYVRAQQRASKRAVALGLSRSACGSGGRQSRAPKGAKADTARASSARAATSDEPAQQRPPRQAALLAANKTAQYARTGVFPQSAMDIQPYGGAQQATQHLADAASGGSAGGGPACGSAAAAVAQQAPPGTPDCSSFHGSCGSEQEGVTVEVVVGAGEGEGDVDACGAASASATGDACACPLPVSSLALTPPFASFLAASSAAAAGEAGTALAAAPLVLAVALGMPGRGAMVPVLPPPSASPATHALACHPHGAAAASLGGGGGGGGGGLLRLPSDALPLSSSIPNGCVLLAPGYHSHRDLCGAAERAAARGGCNPSLSGGSLGLAAAACCDHLAGASVVASVPVSPTSARVQGYAAVYDDAAGLDVDADVDADADARMEEAFGGGCLHEPHQHQLQLECCSAAGAGGGVGDEFGRLVEAEVDFGLGADGGMGLGGGEGLFDEMHPHHGACMADDHHLLPHADADADACGLHDLPIVAARAAPYCAELAAGSEARGILEALPALMAGGGAPPEAPAAGAPALGGEAVSQLLVLGRQASRATTEALAADAALQAVSQVLEAHQEAARRAREAAATNLGILRDYCCGMAAAGGRDAAAALAEMSGLIDVRDIGGGGGAGGDGGGLLAGCGGYLEGGAVDLVAVHS